MLIDVLRKVDQGHNVDSELSENGSNDVDIEDVGLRAFFGQTLDRLL